MRIEHYSSYTIARQQSRYIYSFILSLITQLTERNYGKTADWIWMPFGVVSGVGLGMGVLDFGGDRQRGRGRLG